MCNAEAVIETQPLFEALVRVTRAPMAAYGVLRDGQLIASGGYGGASTTTRFRIASMTKSFTAALVLSLRDEGLLDIHTPVAEFDPVLAGLDAAALREWPDPAPITTRHLMTMAAGLPTDDPWADRHLDATPDELDAWLAAEVASIAAPGTRFEYSNLGYACIGRVIERVTGSRPQELISARFLDTLGMHSTGWDVPGDDVDWARPHRLQDAQVCLDDRPPLADGVVAPMGGLWTTVEDLAKWVAFLSDRHRGDQLSMASRAEMATVATPFASDEDAPQGGGYAMGLNVVRDRALGEFVSHSGGLPGYGSNMAWLPGGPLGVISMANITYAPMWRTNRVLLQHVSQLSSPVDGPIASLGARLVGLLNNWTAASADEVFADNVGPDESLERRAAAAAKLVAEHGALEIAAIEPEHQGRAKLTLLGSSSHALLVCEFSRSPHAQPLVQFYKVDVWR